MDSLKRLEPFAYQSTDCPVCESPEADRYHVARIREGEVIFLYAVVDVARSTSGLGLPTAHSILFERTGFGGFLFHRTDRQHANLEKIATFLKWRRLERSPIGWDSTE